MDAQSISDGAMIGAETGVSAGVGACGLVMETTGFTGGASCLVAMVGGAFLRARHSSNIALSWSAASGSLDCSNLIALAKEASKVCVEVISANRCRNNRHE